MTNAIRIRMYRVGFGDCFLLRLGESYILIDFGVHPGGDLGVMEQVLADIEKETGGKLALLVVTHAHKDHVSGFGAYLERFTKFKIGALWMPWTENPKDKNAAAVKNKQTAFYHALQARLQAAPALTGAARTAREAAREALVNLTGMEKAMGALRRGLDTGVGPEYFAAGDKIASVAGVAGLTVEVLGPPKDRATLGKMDPPQSQRYLTGAAAAQAAIDPFPGKGSRHGKGSQKLTAEYKELLVANTTVSDEQMALAWDQMVNNSSLALLLRYQGRTMLFPGDAQWGNWDGWIEKPEAKSLLESLDFLKVAHHGSHNGTPRSVVAALDKGKVAAMIPTQVTPFPSIPRGPLLTDLRGHTRALVRSDSLHVDGAKDGPDAGKPMPKGFRKGKLWIDYEF
jgi:beta-lactamase superfamily II metal-dependent hydrolase